MVEMRHPVPAQLRCVGDRTPVDLNRPANGPQLQLIADPNSTSLDESLRQRDLKFAGHLRHEADHDMIQGCRQGFRLDSLAVRAMLYALGVILHERLTEAVVRRNY
jgi:hypothetical protein